MLPTESHSHVSLRTPYAVEPSKKCITYIIMPHMPTTKATVARHVCTWLQRS